MAGGSPTGLNGMPRDPRADQRIRRALARLGQTDWLVSGNGTYLNQSGQIEVQLANDTLIIVTQTGLEVNTASATAIITDEVFRAHPTTYADPNTAYTTRPNTFIVSPQTIIPEKDTHKGLVIKAHSPTQSANLQEWQSSVGDFLGGVGPNGHAAFGPQSAVDLPAYLGPQGGGHTILALSETFTDLTSVAVAEGLTVYVIASPVALPSAGFYMAGGDTEMRTDSANSTDLTNLTLTANYFAVIHYAPANLGYMNGVNGFVNNYGIGTFGTATGISGEFYVGPGAGGGTTAYCLFLAGDTDGGAIGTAYGAYCVIGGGAGSISTAYGFYLAAIGNITTNAYGFYIEDQSAAGASGANENIHSAGPNSSNIFEGSLAVGRATKPVASAAFEIDSTTQGFLPPAMTTTQKNAISAPAEGLTVYDTTLHAPAVYNGTVWEEIAATDGASNILAGQVFGG